MDSNFPLLSIILPVYNGARWFGKALDSTIRATDGLAAEIIVVDDGSTDSSLQIAERFAKKALTTQIRIIKSTVNDGIVSALNRGIDASTGRFIARMDADDVCMPDRFKKQVAFLQETGCDLCGSWFAEFGQGFPRKVRWPHAESSLRAAMLFQNTICHPTVMAKREVFERFRYREEYRLAEDYDLFARASAEFKISNVPNVLLRYRRHPKQSTQAHKDSMEAVTCRIRVEALISAGITPSAEEQRVHNLIRAPHSIHSTSDISAIEDWLLKLLGSFDEPEAQRVIASQWIRACIRSAPLGRKMWDIYRASPLYDESGATQMTDLDLRILSLTRLDYASPIFKNLHRLGLSS